MQKQSKMFLFSFIFASTTILSGYICISVKIGYPLTFSEFVRFSGIIIWNSTLHAEENGGSRSLRLAKEAILNPVSDEIIEIGGQKYSYPLPKFSVCQGGQVYLTFASTAELQNYFYRELQAAGWEHIYQMGAGHFFEGYGMKMSIICDFYLGRGISRIALQIVKN